MSENGQGWQEVGSGTGLGKGITFIRAVPPTAPAFRHGWKTCPSRTRLIVLHFTALLTVSALLTGCSKDTAEKEPSVPVQAASVATGTITRIVEAEAILFPLQQSAIVPKISAPVKTFYVTRGSHVHKGQLLATLENRDLAAAAQDTRGSYDQAQATYQTTTGADLPETIQKAQLDAQAAKQNLAAQQQIYDSRKDLFQQGAIPRKELDQSGVDLTQARNQWEIAQKHLDALMAIGKQGTLKSAAGQLESAKGKYLGAEAQLGYSEIRSPIDGVIADRPLYPGEMATPGSPILTVMDISRVIARTHIAQQDAALLKVGDPATILSGEAGAKPVDGKVTVVSPALDPNSTTVEVWIEAKNAKETLRPGSSVKLSIVTKVVPDAVIVPAASLLTAPDGGTFVMQIGQDSRAHQRTVQVAIRQGDQVQIADGVHVGDRVVTTGAYGLPDNSKIEIKTAAQGSNDESAKPAAGDSDGAK